MILAVNAAEELLQVVLGGPQGLAQSFESACAGRMNEVLAPAVADMLSACGLAPAELDGVACVRGPGSFTGVRLGLAFCHGLAFAAGLPLAGIDYLPLLAASAPEGFTGQTHVLTHSRMGKVYHQGFFGPQCAPMGPPRDLAALEAAGELHARAAQGPLRLLGSGLARNPEAFAQLGPEVLRLPPAACAPSLQALMRAALAAPRQAPPVDALYLRGSDAEENLAAIAASRGLDPQKAHKRLEEALAGGRVV